MGGGDVAGKTFDRTVQAVSVGAGVLARASWRRFTQHFSVRREKALVHSGKKTRPGTGSLHPVAIGAAVEVTKPPKPPV